jgi:hypothetical protein
MTQHLREISIFLPSLVVGGASSFLVMSKSPRKSLIRYMFMAVFVLSGGYFIYQINPAGEHHKAPLSEAATGFYLGCMFFVLTASLFKQTDEGFNPKS